MSALEATIVVVTLVIGIAMIVWFFRSKHPEQGTGSAEKPLESDSDQFYDAADRPAGPDAETNMGARPSASSDPRPEGNPDRVLPPN
jgi:hypothetical protein